MSFRDLLDRTVTIVPRVTGSLDVRRNELLVDGTPIVGVPAGRELDYATDEDTDERDRQTARYLYFLPITTDDGTLVTLSGYDRIVDGDETFEVDGEPELVIRRRGRRAHHYEARVYRVTG